MAAVTTDLRDVLVIGVPAVIAAVLLVAGNSAGTTVVSTSVVVVVRHNLYPPKFGSNFASGHHRIDGNPPRSSASLVSNKKL